MKVKCINNITPAESGFLGFGSKPETKIDGLTLYKVYDVYPVGMATGSIIQGQGSVKSVADFLLFDDNGDWVLHDTDLFVPDKG